MKIITGIIILVLIIGGIVGIYIFINDQSNQKELAQLDSAEFVETVEVEQQESVSQISLTKESGVWSVSNESDYTIDVDSIDFQFTGYKVGGSHDGTFENMNVVIGLDEDGNPVTGRIIIDASSVKTDTPAVDTHLQTDDFFGVEQYPEITIDIKQIQQQEEQLIAFSDVFMKGVTRTIAIPMQLTQEEDKMTFTIDSRINMSDFNIAYGPVRDDVRIMLSGTIVKN